MAKEQAVPVKTKFILGALSGLGSSAWIHPLDLIKNRMQVSGEGGKLSQYRSPFHCAHSIYKTEGFTGFYGGWTAGLARQLLYTTVRLGLYHVMLDDYKTRHNIERAGILPTTVMGITSGGIGAIIGNPADVALVRMTVDKRLPPAERRNYTSVFNAWRRIIAEEGFMSLWTGCRPTIGRAMVVNACQLSINTQAKYKLQTYSSISNYYVLSFVSSCTSGFITTCIVLPFDVAKTRMQNMNKTTGNPQYSGWINVWRTTIKVEGIRALWKGFTPYFIRTPMTLFLMDVFMYQYAQSH